MPPSFSFQQRAVILWVTLSVYAISCLVAIRIVLLSLLRSSVANRMHQNPAKPSGLLYGIVTLATSSSEPSGLMA